MINMQRLQQIIDTFWQATTSQKVGFLLVFFLVFTMTYTVLYALDWLPEAPVEAAPAAFVEVAEAVTSTEPEPIAPVPVVIEQPVEIYIPALNRTVAVFNTPTSDIAALDADLLKGVVRHPDSALLGQEGNVFILGHSSYLPNVMNRNFQAFNGLQDLDWGDTVMLRSETTEYIYIVKRVYQTKASGVTIPVAVAGQKLTLVTCNNFGSIEDRYILEAEILETRPL